MISAYSFDRTKCDPQQLKVFGIHFLAIIEFFIDIFISCGICNAAESFSYCMQFFFLTSLKVLLKISINSLGNLQQALDEKRDIIQSGRRQLRSSCISVNFGSSQRDEFDHLTANCTEISKGFFCRQFVPLTDLQVQT